MSDTDYSEIVLKHSPWSVSKVGVLNTCGKQYLHKYVEKISEGKKSDASLVGVVTHAIVEAGLRTPGINLKEVMLQSAEHERLSREELITCSAKLSAIEDFLKRIAEFKKNNGVTDEYIEHKLAISSTYQPAPFMDIRDASGQVVSKSLLRGVIDYAPRTNDDFLIVIDHKSGKKKPIGDHSTQFYVYMVLAVVNFPWVKGIQSGINYIGEPRMDWFPRFDGKPGAWLREEIVGIVFPWLRQYLNRTALKLESVDNGEPRPETGWQCGYCGFALNCEKGKEEIEKRAKNKLKLNL